MKRFSVRFFCILLCLSLLSAAAPLFAARAEEAPVTPYRVGDTVRFGSYPQTRVTDETLEKALNGVEAEWTAYPYSVGDGARGTMRQSSFAYYKDVTCGGVKYRGVKMTKYRPSAVYEPNPAAEEAAQYENGYELRKVYWFRFDPIDWIVLDPASGLMAAASILDGQAFSDTVYEVETETEEDGWSWTSSEVFSDPEGLYPANRYETSTLRAWLNGTFYKAAFNKQQRARILPQTLVTPAGETETETKDRVFLLSAGDTQNEALYRETEWGDPYSILGDVNTTDYAGSQGLYGYWYSEPWFLRSPGVGNGYVQTFGWGLSDADAGRIGGVRPAICVDFNECAAGDVDGDGAVTVTDARAVLRVSVELSLIPAYAERYADADGDGKITPADARALLRCAVGLDTQDHFSHFLQETVPVYNSDGFAIGSKRRLGELTLTEGGAASLGDKVVVRQCDKPRWVSSNPAAVKVSADGTVKALKKGFSCVHLTCGGQRYYFYVSVHSAFQEKIWALQEKYPDGYYWNAHTKSKQYPAVSEIPCTDHAAGTYAYCIGQCAGFAYLMSNEVYGAGAPYRYGLKKENIGIGDYVRCLPNHSVFVIDRVNKGEIVDYDFFSDENITADSDMITVVECNWDCRCGISWGRRIRLDNLKIDEGYSFTRR